MAVRLLELISVLALFLQSGHMMKSIRKSKELLSSLIILLFSILIGKTGRDIVAAGVALYGSRTSVLIDSDGKTEEYSLVKSKANGEFEWAKSMENIKIEENTKFFAPGNLRAVNENAEYKELVDYWISKNFTLRYQF